MLWDLQLIFTAGVLMFYKVIQKTDSVRREPTHRVTLPQTLVFFFLVRLSNVVQLIKTQRRILGFNMQVRKAEQPATGSYLHLSLKRLILYVCFCLKTLYLLRIADLLTSKLASSTAVYT